MITWDFLLNSIKKMGQSYISSRLERTAENRNGQKNDLSTLAPKCFSHIWPRGPEPALESRADDSFSPRSTPSPVCALGLEGWLAFELPFKM